MSDLINSPGNTAQSLDCTELFGISRWHAWAPGIKDRKDWPAWQSGHLTPEPDDQPEVSYLPALLRRRLDRLGRMALHTAWPCVEGLDSVQLVFASRHGSLNRTVELLAALAKEEVLSPTLFSLAVHNSIAGLFSIARSDRGAATAMAAGADSLGLSLLEGANLIAEGAKCVLVTYADEAVPRPYQTFVPEPANHAFAVSLLLTPAVGTSLSCRLGRHAGSAPDQLPEAALMRFLLNDVSEVLLGVDQVWRLERAHAG